MPAQVQAVLFDWDVWADETRQAAALSTQCRAFLRGGFVDIRFCICMFLFFSTKWSTRDNLLDPAFYNRIYGTDVYISSIDSF